MLANEGTVMSLQNMNSFSGTDKSVHSVTAGAQCSSDCVPEGWKDPCPAEAGG